MMIILLGWKMSLALELGGDAVFERDDGMVWLSEMEMSVYFFWYDLFSSGKREMTVIMTETILDTYVVDARRLHVWYGMAYWMESEMISR